MIPISELGLMKDWLLMLEGKYGADDPRCLNLRDQITKIIGDKLKAPGLADRLSPQELVKLIYGE